MQILDRKVWKCFQCANHVWKPTKRAIDHASMTIRSEFIVKMYLWRPSWKMAYTTVNIKNRAWQQADLNSAGQNT